MVPWKVGLEIVGGSQAKEDRSSLDPKESVSYVCISFLTMRFKKICETTSFSVKRIGLGRPMAECHLCLPLDE